MIWFYIALGILFLVVCPMFFIQFFVARSLFFKYMVRSDNENWTRELVAEDDEEAKMFAFCEKFEAENESFAKDVEITSDGFNLKGRYYDYGFKRACIIVAGRSEALRYSLYFAPPYKEAGFNVLVIDNRSHGFSEGKYNSLGLKEFRDLIEWARLLHDGEGNDLVIGHGICIGSATLLYAQINERCPYYFKGIVADGMYCDFPTSFNNHAIEAGYGIHFVSDFFFMLFKHYTKENPYYGPLDCIDKMKNPMLFIYSKMDAYSKPDKGQELFNLCGAEIKRLEWFEKGIHSHVRVNDEKRYDEVIIDFLNKTFERKY